MENLQLYKNILSPGQYVSIVITDNKQNNSIPVEIIDYNLTGFIPIKNLTKKKRIKKINKIAPMKKVIPAIVDTIDGVIIILTRLNISKDSDEYKRWQDDMFTSNKIRSLINYMKINDITSDIILKNIIYPSQSNWDKKETLFDYIKDNYGNLDLKMNVSVLLKKFMDNTNHVKKTIYKTRFGLIATENVSDMINKIEPVVKKYNHLSIVIENCPYFLINSDSYNSKKDDHSNFLKELDSLENKNFILKLL
tara:strand:+ start:1697 stop:2449 length:753 start_codon:yes stop_codon:yes gene_type:complete